MFIGYIGLLIPRLFRPWQYRYLELNYDVRDRHELPLVALLFTGVFSLVVEPIEPNFPDADR